MKKWPLHLTVITILGLSWLICGTVWIRSKHTREEAVMKIGMSYDTEEDERLRKVIEDIDKRKFTLTMGALVLTCATFAYIGVCVSTTILPALAQRATDIAYGSGAEVEPDAMRDAHVHIAKGEYAEAIEDFRHAIKEDPLNRQAWWEIGKLQLQKLEDPKAAIGNYCKALKQEGWADEDEAFLWFRLSEAHIAAGEKTEAAACMREVIARFPESRHSANASHQLQEWGEA